MYDVRRLYCGRYRDAKFCVSTYQNKVYLCRLKFDSVETFHETSLLSGPIAQLVRASDS